MKVKVLQEATISYGPQRLVAGAEVELPDDVVAGLVELGVVASVGVPTASKRSNRSHRGSRPETPSIEAGSVEEASEEPSEPSGEPSEE